MQNTAVIIYGIFAAAVASAITIKSGTNHRILGFLLTFWILGASVVHEPAFDLPLKALGGNMQMMQLLFYVLTAHLLFFSLLRFRLDEPLRSLPFEKFLYIYMGWLVCVLLYHFVRGELGGRELRGVMEGNLAVLVVYLNIKRFGDAAMLRALGIALTVVAVVSSLLALVQFIGGADFVLVGNGYPAFGDRIRGSGLFSSEYLHSYTCVAALLLTLVFVDPGKLRVALIALLLTGVIVSFHRMSWIVTGILILLYLVYVKRVRVGQIAFALVTCFVVIYVLSTQFGTVAHEMEGSELFQSRLGSDTITDRLKFYSMALGLFTRNPVWGVGTKESSLYFYGMLGTGFNLQWARGEIGGIHNLYLELLFLYGVPLLVLFLVFLGSVLFTWQRWLRTRSGFFLLPFAFCLVYCVLNLTNTVPLNSEIGMLFAMIVGAAAFVAERGLGESADDVSLWVPA